MKKLRKRFWVILCIVMSYVFTYFVPIYLLYLAWRDKFATEYVTANYSLQFLGFVTFVAIFGLAFMIKILIVLFKSKASIFKHFMLGAINVGVFVGIIYGIIVLREFTYVIETDTIKFFNLFRAFLNSCKNYLVTYAACLGLASISKIAAVIIDREYARSLEWL